MTTTVELKSKKSNLKKHLSNQYKQMIANKKEKNTTNNWPIDFNQFVTKKEICPESWAVLSMNH